MEIKYGETVQDQEFTLFVVETKWPDRADEHPARWARYNASAFNDKRDPKTTRDGYGSCHGTFDAVNQDVANVESRVRERQPYGGLGGDYAAHPTFTVVGDALAYAERLAEFGECSAMYSDGGTPESRKARYSGAVRVRVVSDHRATMQQVVVGLELDDDEKAGRALSALDQLSEEYKNDPRVQAIIGEFLTGAKKHELTRLYDLVRAAK